jgi:serine/threonine-protein kinase
MGVVYRARQTTMDREVAVKILRPELVVLEKAVRRFINEAKAISRLRHPNTLRIFDCRLSPAGPMYIVTELLRGRSLANLIAVLGPMPYPRAVHIADRVAASLAEAHSMGIIHRDIKPENVFIDQIGGRDFIKVLDFGIAKILDGEPGLTTLGNVVGIFHRSRRAATSSTRARISTRSASCSITCARARRRFRGAGRRRRSRSTCSWSRRRSTSRSRRRWRC